MILFQRLARFLAFVIFCGASYAFACEAPNEAPYPPLAVEGGMIVFSSIAVLEDEGKPNPEMGLGVSFLDCSTGIAKFISRLPYVAGPGEVRDVFTENVVNGDKELFVIHSAPIRAFTGISYGSDYFSVMVFHKVEGGFTSDKKLTDYFGSGADVLSPDDNDDKPIYTYPFKARDAVVSQLASKNYRGWASGNLPDLNVNKKTSIYSLKSMASDTDMYLIKGDKVKQEAVSAGWVSIVYTTAKKKEIRGWVLCENVDRC
ncbi:hypothetical protein ACIPIN_14660 [Pseudomonas sp. NPDC087697]|uniref:hypothetical protein n=1 Tax=Pseudomonas sp. NPDC087697 TaxID=3364447 RepID=UPI00381CBD6C